MVNNSKIAMNLGTGGTSAPAIKRVSGNNANRDAIPSSKEMEEASGLLGGERKSSDVGERVLEDYAKNNGKFATDDGRYGLNSIFNNFGLMPSALTGYANSSLTNQTNNIKTGDAVASDYGRKLINNRDAYDSEGFVGGIANLDAETRQLLLQNNGEGLISVINATESGNVSWMDGNGNMLSQNLLKKVNKGMSLGEAINSANGEVETCYDGAGRLRKQTLNINGKELPNNFGSAENPASWAVFLADVHHGRDGSKFYADYQNFADIALASGVPKENIRLAKNFNEFKAHLKDAEASGGNGLMTGIAAHGFSWGGRGPHDERAMSGFVVAGQQVNEDVYEGAVAGAAIKGEFKHAISINCPCHSGGFDGDVTLPGQPLAKEPKKEEPNSDKTVSKNDKEELNKKEWESKGALC